MFSDGRHVGTGEREWVSGPAVWASSSSARTAHDCGKTDRWQEAMAERHTCHGDSHQPGWHTPLQSTGSSFVSSRWFTFSHKRMHHDPAQLQEILPWGPFNYEQPWVTGVHPQSRGRDRDQGSQGLGEQLQGLF